MTVPRDAYSDCSRDGGGQQRREDVAADTTFRPLTVAEERARHGYNLGDTPTGDGTPMRLDTSGNRGASDIRPR